MNRRQFVSKAAAAAAFVRIPDLLTAKGAKYDLIVKGGRLIDPSRKLDAIRDVAIAQGRIAAIEPNIPADAVETIDARGDPKACPKAWNATGEVHLLPDPELLEGVCENNLDPTHKVGE